MRPLQGLRRVRVGSGNRPKIEAVREAIRAFAPDAEVFGETVESGVPEQPVGWQEIAEGARRRARAALALGDCELGVGIEDGLVVLHELGGRVFNVGAAVVCDGGREGLGLSSGFAYPPECSDRAVAERMPIGDLFDELWHRARPDSAVGATPSGRGIGNIGALTGGVLPRSEYGRHAVVCALVRFLHPDLYDDPGTGRSDVRSPAGAGAGSEGNA